MGTNRTAPRTDQGLLAWSNHFVSVVEGPAYGLTTAQLTTYVAANTAYATALAACDKAIRTPAATETKNQARTALRGQITLLTNYLNGLPAVTSAMKKAAGLTVRVKPSAIGAPTSSPAVEVVTVNGSTASLLLHSTETIGKRARPYGVQGAQIYYCVGTIPTTAADWTFYATTSDQQVDVTMDPSVPAGTLVWFTACWVSPRLETGPVAKAVSAHTQFGVTPLAKPAEKTLRAA